MRKSPLGYLNCTRMSVRPLPAGIGLSLVAQPVVFIIFGEKWMDMAPLIQILSVNSVLGVSLSSAAYVYLALGTPRHTTMLVAVSASISIALMLWLVPFLGIRGAAVARRTALAETGPRHDGSASFSLAPLAGRGPG